VCLQGILEPLIQSLSVAETTLQRPRAQKGFQSPPVNMPIDIDVLHALLFLDSALGAQLDPTDLAPQKLQTKFVGAKELGTK